MPSDYDEFLPFFEAMDGTLEEKKVYVGQLWTFVKCIVDKAWDDPENFEEMARKGEEN